MTFTVYRLFDADDRLLYVGRTKRLVARRLYEHSISKSWFDDVASTVIEEFDTNDEMVAAELTALQVEGAIHSPAPGGRRWRPEAAGERDLTYRDYLAIGERIQSMRESRGLTRNELAAACLMDGPIVTCWELGMVLPPRHLRSLVSQALGATVDEIYVEIAEYRSAHLKAVA